MNLEMNQNVKRTFLLLVGWLWISANLVAAVPPPELLLPSDTLGLISVPDWDKAAAFYEQSPLGQLWKDPSLKPFKDNFFKQFKEDAIVSLEKDLGIKFADYTDLIHGQITLAITQGVSDGPSEKKPGILLLLDAKDQADRLKNQLSGLKKKWVDSGRQIRMDQVRDVEFATLVVRPGDLSRTLEKAFPAPDSPTPGKQAEADKKDGEFEITFGQSESLLMVGNSLKEMEKILIRQSGGAVAPLAEQGVYEANHALLFRDALAFAWMNFTPVYEMLLRDLNESAKSAPQNNPMAPPPAKILSTIGLGGLKTIAFRLSGSPEGSLAELYLGVPEAGRQGIFKILVAEAKDAGPPPFVPSQAVKFSRWRLDGQKAWATLEAMITSISPEVANLFQMGMATIGKDKDPNFDLKKNLIGNLGDDFIVFEKNARSATLEDLSSPPALFLIGSPDAEKLAQAVNAGASVFSMATGANSQEREFLGRKVYSFPLPTPSAGNGGKASKPTLSFSAGAGYLALSTDSAMLEEFLRSNESTGKILRETPGLNEAAQRVGGMSTGLFGYENQSETMRVAFETMKNDFDKLGKLLSLAALKDKLSAAGQAKEIKDWFDFSLLPSFDRIAKYFYFVVYSGSATAGGLSWKMFAPAPPEMTK